MERGKRRGAVISDDIDTTRAIQIREQLIRSLRGSFRCIFGRDGPRQRGEVCKGRKYVIKNILKIRFISFIFEIFAISFICSFDIPISIQVLFH